MIILFSFYAIAKAIELFALPGNQFDITLLQVTASCLPKFVLQILYMACFHSHMHLIYGMPF